MRRSTSSKYKRIGIGVALVVTGATCCLGYLFQRSNRYHQALHVADSLIKVAPDSALGYLNGLQGEEDKMPTLLRMRYQLLRVNAENKNDTLFLSDSTQTMLVRYFDRHGTPNERLLAHYLLGRAYSDMGETPAALQAFQDAVACADTTSADCDRHQLMIVCGQIAQMYNLQFMPDYELTALQQAIRYAFQENDSVMAFLYEGKKADAYEQKGQYDSVAVVNERVYGMLCSLGRSDLAAANLSSLIYSELCTGDIDRARHHLNIYERASGFIDSTGVAIAGKEIYYYFKGMVSLHDGHFAMAEQYFRDLLRYKDNIEQLHAGYEGLRSLYRHTGQKDSLARYAELSAAYNDSLHASMYTTNLQAISGLYDYSRHERQAEWLRHENEKARNNLILLSLLGSVVILACVYLLRKRSKRYHEMRLVYQANMEALGTAKAELVAAMQRKESAYKLLIEEKRRQVEVVQQKLSDISARQWQMDMAAQEQQLLTADVCLLFQQHARTLSNPSHDDWHRLRQHVADMLPQFPATLLVKHQLSLSDYDMCILYRLRFRQKEIAFLLGLNPTSMPSKRNRLFEKLFGRKDRNREFQDFLDAIR